MIYTDLDKTKKRHDTTFCRIIETKHQIGTPKICEEIITTLMMTY